MASLLIENATIVSPDGLLPGHTILCREGKICEVTAAGGAPRSADEVVDAAGLYLAPGYIDLHIHGTHHSLIDSGPDDLAELCRVLPRYGVTGYLPTVCPLPKGQDAAFVSSLATVRSEGTRILGFHLEGPFLAHTGALPPEALGASDPSRVEALIAACEPYAAIFSVAPDFKGILDLLPIMRRGDRPIFMTHTGANVKEAQDAIEAGVRHATHFYDVFPIPPETEPGARPCGAVEAVLADPRVTVDFILDGEHVDPVAVRVALACKGTAGVCLITDANVGAGLPPGRYAFAGDTEITFDYQGGPARLTEKSRHPGALAGSGLTMDLAVRNARSMLGLGVHEAVAMASASPAGVLGLGEQKGRIAKGWDADVVLLDEALRVRRTWIGGNSAYVAG